MTSQASRPPLYQETCVYPSANESQGEIATVETLRVPTDRDDRLRGIAVCQRLHLLVQTILHRVGGAAAAPCVLEPHSTGNRPPPRIQERIDDNRFALADQLLKLNGKDRRRAGHTGRRHSGHVGSQISIRSHAEIGTFRSMIAVPRETQRRLILLHLLRGHIV